MSETNNEKRAHAILKEEKSRIERLIGALGFTLRLGRHEDIWNNHFSWHACCKPSRVTCIDCPLKVDIFKSI